MNNVLLFSTVSAPERAARVHAPACPLVAAAARSRGKVRVIRDDLDAVIADLNDRQYPVKHCKCTRAK